MAKRGRLRKARRAAQIMQNVPKTSCFRDVSACGRLGSKLPATATPTRFSLQYCGYARPQAAKSAKKRFYCEKSASWPPYKLPQEGGLLGWLSTRDDALGSGRAAATIAVRKGCGPIALSWVFVKAPGRRAGDNPGATCPRAGGTACRNVTSWQSRSSGRWR